MDEYALDSHRKAVAAQDNGALEAEIVPISVQGPKGAVTVVRQDEAPRRDTSLEALGKLKPSFVPNGRVTAGNAPGLNDAAAAVVVAPSCDGAKTDICRACGGHHAFVGESWLDAGGG
jgi:acetyl-CoA C-acetyltransferase